MPFASGFQLRILKGNQQGLVVPLVEQRYILGRATSQGEQAAGYLFFYEPTVSRVHAELRWNEKKKSYFVHHQSKTNPTLVEGVPVDKKTPRQLDKGNKIQMGYLVLEVEAQTVSQGAPETKVTPVPAGRTEEGAKTHKMMVGNILEALSNLNQERANTTRLNTPDPRTPKAPEPEPEPERAPANNYLERDYGAATEQGGKEILITVAQGPDKNSVFTLRDQVNVIGRALGKEDPRMGQGVLLQDDSLPKEAAYVVWQSRDQAYGLTESETPGVTIRVRRVQRGQPIDLTVTAGSPVLLQDGDMIHLGRSSLMVRAKGATAVTEWGPRDAAPPQVRANPTPSIEGGAGMPSPWGRPSDSPAPPPASGSDSGGIVPRNFPGSGSLGVAPRPGATSPPPPPTPPSRISLSAPTEVMGEEESEEDSTPVVKTFKLPTPPTPPRAQPTLLGRGSGGLSPSRPDPPRPVPEPAALDPSNAPTLAGASQPRQSITTPAEDRSQDMQPLSWPWRDNSDFVFDFVSGSNRGRQIALNAAEMQDDRVITLGSGAEQYDITLDGPGHAAALRYRQRRFALLNQGPDDSVQVNRVPLKRGDQVVLMTGDRIDIGESCFRFLERAVVEVLQTFQVVVESGVDQDQDKVYPFCKQRLLIGRGKNCDVRLSDLEVSRIHVALVHRDGKFFVQHRSETNPTFLNGMSLLQGGERLIQPGDRIRLSSLTLLQFAKAEPRKRAYASGAAR